MYVHMIVSCAIVVMEVVSGPDNCNNLVTSNSDNNIRNLMQNIGSGCSRQVLLGCYGE